MAGRYRVSDPAQRTIDGRTFDSRAEARRYGELKLLERVGSITDLELQPTFELLPAFVHPVQGKQRAITYRADFRYRKRGVWIVEDVKGHRTEVYKIKRKMFLRRYPDVEFEEVMV